MSDIVGANVAVKLDTSVWINRNGQICRGEGLCVCKIFHKFVIPDMYICGDEVGFNKKERP